MGLTLSKVLIIQNFNLYYVKIIVDDLHMKELKNWKVAEI